MPPPGSTVEFLLVVAPKFMNAIFTAATEPPVLPPLEDEEGTEKIGVPAADPPDAATTGEEILVLPPADGATEYERSLVVELLG